MPIREKSFRIGCGRYLQGEGILNECGKEALRLGKAPLIVGGKTALSVTRCEIEKSVSAACERYVIKEHCGSCNDEDATALASLMKKEGLDLVIGVGGGVIMDFAKLVAHFASLPIINIPTSSATCAAYTPLSVRYTHEGRTVGTLHYEKEVDAVLVDTSVIASEPTRLFLAGIFDSIAKFVEIKHRFSKGSESPLGLDWAYVLSSHSYGELCEKAEQCLESMKNGVISDELERVIFTKIAVTGVISGIARGSNQTALAHKFYETARLLFPEETKPYLHGELVGVGLLLQNHFNGEEKENEGLIKLMKGYGMPYRVTDVGVNDSYEKFYEKIIRSSAMENREEDSERLRESLKYLWSIGE